MRVARFPKSSRSLAALAGGALSISVIAAGAAAVPAAAAAARPAAPASGAHCTLSGGTIKHVIYLQFDNVHFRRDNPNVPSDLEQTPNLAGQARALLDDGAGVLRAAAGLAGTSQG